ncbi:hypothetical protein D3C85_349710 [compost metagenome]
MASTQTKISKGIILVLFAAVLFVAIKYSVGTPSRESVRYSTMDCVQSVCVSNKATGDICSVAEPRISEVLIESDAINPNIRNIRVIPSDDRCQ